MRSQCVIKECDSNGATVKCDEDFEVLIHGICWKCGTRLKEIIGYELMNDFKFVIDLIEGNID